MQIWSLDLSCDIHKWVACVSSSFYLINVWEINKMYMRNCYLLFFLQLIVQVIKCLNNVCIFQFWFLILFVQFVVDIMFNYFEDAMECNCNYDDSLKYSQGQMNQNMPLLLFYVLLKKKLIVVIWMKKLTIKWTFIN